MNRPKLRHRNIILAKINNNQKCWNESIAFYNDPERRLTYRFIMPGCLEFLSEDSRKRLSNDEKIKLP